MGIEFYSFEDALNFAVGELEGRPDRRAEGRLRIVYRVARARAGGDHGLARVVNISDHGLMLSTRLDVMLGDEVMVDLSEACSLTGHVVWRNLEQCGLKLAVPIDSAALLARLRAQLRAPGARQLRVPLDKEVVVTSALGMRIVRLRDISQRGAKIVHDGQLSAGLAIKIQIAPRVECRGLVRWSQDGLAGIEFEEVLSVEQLGSMKSL